MAKRLITPRIGRLFKDYSEAMIRDFGKRISVILVTVAKSPCPNCNFDPVTKVSSNVYNGTGPKPFAKGQCPVCQGKGNIEQKNEQKITASGRWGSLAKNQPAPIWNQGELEEGSVQIKGFYKDMAAVQNCAYAIIDGVRVSRRGTPKPRGLQKYITFTAVFQRDD